MLSTKGLIINHHFSLYKVKFPLLNIRCSACGIFQHFSNYPPAKRFCISPVCAYLESLVG